MDITHVDPLGLDLEAADRLAAVQQAALAAAGTALPAPVGASLLGQLRHGSAGLPVPGLLVAADDGAVTGWATVELPRLENTWAAHLRGWVHPAGRGRGIGAALHEAALELVHTAGRSTVYAGSFDGSGGAEALASWGYRQDGQAEYAIRRIDLHGRGAAAWRGLSGVAAPHYELVPLAGPAPEAQLPGLVTLHAAINDAPPDDADREAMVWGADRVVAYDEAMAARRQTVHRLLARHTPTGDWAGMTVLCVDEHRPRIAFQEDTSVVPAHRGRGLGLLLKAELHRWVSGRRPEVEATDTWNAVDNHHMVAVNERLGARVVTHHRGARKDLS